MDERASHVPGGGQYPESSIAEPAADASPDGFVDTLRTRGRARIGLVAQTRLPDGGLATDFTARYVAILK